MKPRIVDFGIKNFRSFRKLDLKGLGRVNLITGRNNTGKSTILESLRLLISDNVPSTIHSILVDREVDLFDVDESGRTHADNAQQILTLFHGFPEMSESWEPIVISSSGSPRPMSLTLALKWFSEERGENGARSYVSRQLDLLDEDEDVLALEYKSGGAERVFPLDYFRRPSFRRHRVRPEYGSLSPIPCTYVSPYGGESTARLGELWDKIALSDLEEQVINALKIVDPSISGVSMVRGEMRSRTAIVRSRKIHRPVSLRSFGDGLNRLFGISLALVNAKDGLLIIDEFENGMHYSIQLDTWRMIFKLAAELRVQVFATSHSWDAIEAFQKAAAESPEEGVLVRLARKGEDIISTLFREDELRVATRDGIEVR